MVKRITARPATQPVRAAVISDEGPAQDNAGAGADAAAKKKASTEARQKTIKSTMVFAGMGTRRSEQAASKARTKTATKVKPKVASKPQAEMVESAAEVETPTAAIVAVVPELLADPAAGESDPQPVEAAAAEPAATSTPRKRGTSRQQLVGRISSAISNHLDLIEAIIREAPGDNSRLPDTERHARTIAALARVLAELRKEPAAAGAEQRRTDDGDRPRDIAELRARLARRLEQYRAGRI